MLKISSVLHLKTPSTKEDGNLNRNLNLNHIYSRESQGIRLGNLVHNNKQKRENKKVKPKYCKLRNMKRK